VEKVADAWHAAIADLAACSKSLGSLHQLGIVHGDVNKHNFLTNADGVTIVDSEFVRRRDDERSFEGEMGSLAERLQDVSGRGGSHAEAAAV
jgi:tRNA A-37 threonylcarbamoyl transferase component Bud32